MTLLSDREQQIKAILTKRQTLAKQFDSKLTLLGALRSTVELMTHRRNEIAESTTNAQIRNRLGEINLEGIIDALQIEERKIKSYCTILSRDTINIGVVGLARQGKSQLLRSLSGLDNRTIPTGPFGHCTGTKSVFVNGESTASRAEIYFYREDEFLRKIISPYYEKLFDAVPSPKTIQEFDRQPLPILPTKKQQNVSDKVKYAQLELYKQHLTDYKHLLEASSPLTIPVERVRDFVAQDDERGERQVFNAMAVREARIIGKFPQETMRELLLIDMPGLGDTGLVAEQWLTESLFDEIDIVLFVKKPSGLGEVWKPQELDLYDTVRKAQPDIPIELRSLLIMNRVHSSSPNDDNVKNCERLVKEAAEQMKFSGILVADCSNPEEVNRVILDEILNHITDKIDSINRSYSNDCTASVKRVHSMISAALAKAEDAIGTSEHQTFNFSTFNKLFRHTIRRVYSSLEKLNNELKYQRDTPDSSFENYVNESKERAYINSGIPTLDKIEETRNLFGGYKSACEYYLNYIRTHLTQHFEQLEEGLSESVESVKGQVASILIHTEQGNLTTISSAGGSEFLKEIAALLGEQYLVLDPAFTIFIKFKLSYQSFFYYRLRKHLDYLTPDTGMAELSAKPSAQEIHDLLTAMHKIALERIENEVNYWSVEINHAIFATVEQFVDKVLRSENAMDEWQSFYMENRSKIWPESFPEVFIDTSLRWQWTDAIERVRAANRSIIEL